MTEGDIDFAALMRQSLAGDKRAYSELLTHVSRILRPFLGKRLNNASEVDDVLQEILISLHRARHTYDGERPFKPWIFAIAKFRLQDHLRKHYADHLRRCSEITDADMMIADSVTESGLAYESIKEEIDKLPLKQAKILTLMHQDGYTSKEIAEKIGMKESAVKVAAHRAYKVLKKRLAD